MMEPTTVGELLRTAPSLRERVKTTSDEVWAFGVKDPKGAHPATRTDQDGKGEEDAPDECVVPPEWLQNTMGSDKAQALHTTQHACIVFEGRELCGPVRFQGDKAYVFDGKHWVCA